MSESDPHGLKEIFEKEKAKGQPAETVQIQKPPTPSQPEATATPLKMAMPKPPHSAFFVHRILGPESQGGEAFKRVAPGLRKEKGNEGMILLALVLLSAIISSFGGIAIYGYTHPPIQLVGVCPPPAEVRNGDCVIAQAVSNGQGGTQTVYVSAGQIYFINGTRYSGKP